MSLLTPLYALAGLAIALPVILHLIRRQPKERQWVSSLMFLEPSRPRLTSQSRVDQWLLLLLRAAAIGLLALAFSRPYWNSSVGMEADRVGLQRILLIDTSASMRRAGLWEAALKKVENIIVSANPTDVLALYEFDSSIRPLVSIEEAIQTPPAQRQARALVALARAKPTWNKTDLGLALIRASELSQSDWDSASSRSTAVQSQIDVVTDFQMGSMVDRLAEYSWPASCVVRIERIEPRGNENVYATLLDADPDATVDSDKIKIRVANVTDPSGSLLYGKPLQLQWLDNRMKPIPSSQNPFQITNANALVLKMPAPPSGSAALELIGDPTEFDNRYFIASNKPLPTQVICIEANLDEPKESLRYFLQQLPLSNASREITFVDRTPSSNHSWPNATDAPFIVASHSTTPADFDALTRHVDSGGHLLWVLDAPITTNNDNSINEKYSAGFRMLAGMDNVELSEAKVRQYAMLESIDFKHPLFADLSDSRFNDFSKIRFWKHRRIDPQLVKSWTTLAKFDDGAPALISRDQGTGRIWILFSGWQPTESQLALSTKFVPIITGMFRMAAPDVVNNSSYHVGDSVECFEGERLISPEGIVLQSDPAGLINSIALSEPGIYRRIKSDGNETSIAVNLSETESNTAISDIGRLERLGVAINTNKPLPLSDSDRRQLLATELEAQQGWWRWLIAGVLGVVGLESIVCIRKAS